MKIQKRHCANKALVKLNNGSDLPLIAAANGYTDIIQVLLINGLPVNGIVVNRRMLHEVAGYGQYDTVKFLIENRADIEAKDTEGSTPIHYAATRHHINVTQLFIEHGADIDAPNYYGNTVLHRVVRYKFTDIIKLLLKNGAKINASECIGETSLHLAAKNGGVIIMKLLIDNKADINVKDNLYGWTPLHSVVVRNKVEAVELLVGNGCDREIVDIFDKTSLTYAIEKMDRYC